MQINPMEQIQSISDFRTKTEELLKVMTKNKALLLTQHGKTCAILVDPKTYEEQSEKLRLAEKILRGDREIEEGKGVPQAEVEHISKGWIE